MAHYYDTEVEDTEYLALVRGDVAAVSATGQPVLVRVAAMDPLGDPFVLRPDLLAALEAIDQAGVGVLLYVVNRSRTRLGPSFERLVLQRTAARDKVAEHPERLERGAARLRPRARRCSPISGSSGSG